MGSADQKLWKVKVSIKNRSEGLTQSMMAHGCKMRFSSDIVWNWSFSLVCKDKCVCFHWLFLYCLALLEQPFKWCLQRPVFLCKMRGICCSPVLRPGGGCWWRRRGLPTGSWSSWSLSSLSSSSSPHTCSLTNSPSLHPTLRSSSRRSIDGARLRCFPPGLSTRKQQPGRPSGKACIL